APGRIRREEERGRQEPGPGPVDRIAEREERPPVNPPLPGYGWPVWGGSPRNDGARGALRRPPEEMDPAEPAPHRRLRLPGRGEEPSDRGAAPAEERGAGAGRPEGARDGPGAGVQG